MTATDPVERLRHILENVRPKGNGGFVARCPSHQDPKNSLSVDCGDDGRALVRCFAGCSADQVTAALGLTTRDLFPPPPTAATVRENGHGRPAGATSETPPRRCVATTRYKIRDETGAVVAVHVRRDFSDGTKNVHWEQPDGTSGLGGVPVTALPLYGVHEISDSPEITVVEGEKSRDALDALGIVAVGSVSGAASCPDDTALRPLLGRRVTLWPDHDTAGHQHMLKIAHRLRSLGQPPDALRIVSWSEAPAKADAADCIATDGPDEARHLIATAPAWKHSDAPKQEEASERNLRFRTAREIGETTPETTEYVAAPYLVAGALTELDGKAKSAGKTTFAMAMSAAILDGTEFMGYPTKRSPIVYLSEQAPASLRQSLGRAGLLGSDDFLVLGWHDTIGTDWPEIVAAAVAEARRIGAAVLVVDTLPQFAGMRGDAENNAGETLAALQPLQAAAASGLAVMVCRHERKSGGDVGDYGRGSSAFAGAVDVVLSLRRAEGAARPTIRHIHALSRFDETPDLLVVEWTPDGYIALGTETAVAEAEAREGVLAAAPTNEADAMTEADLLAAADLKRTVGRAAIAAHVEARRLERTGEGKRNNPYRYWRPSEMVSDTLKEGVPSETNATTPNQAKSFLTKPPVVPSESNNGSEKLSDGTCLLRETESIQSNGRDDPALAATVANLLALPPADLAQYRAELDTAGADDPFVAHDRAALARADRMRPKAVR